MTKLDPRIEAVSKEYDLPADAFWQIPQNKQWVCKHAALEVVATKAGIKWQLPQIIEAKTADGIAAMVVAGEMGDRTEWATGEASPKNCKNAYPWAMAEKRAKDRVILKLVGIHGLVYSEEEVDDFKGQQAPLEPTSSHNNKPSAAHMKRQLAEIDNDLLDCHTIQTVNNCAKTWAHIMDRDNWSRDYREAAIPKFNARREAISKSENATVAAIQSQFPGARVVNQHISTIEAG